MKLDKEMSTKGVLSTSVGQKMVIALSGFFLIVFVLIHLSGNILLYVGRDAFNLYTYNMTKNKFILYALEVVLLTGFLTHILLTLRVTLENRRARGKQYEVKKTFGVSTIFSSNMGLSGSLIFIFLIIHLRTFKFGEGVMVSVPGVPGAEVIDMYRIVTQSFENPWYSSFYIIAMLLIGGHLSHGIQSAFKSLGFYDTKMKHFLKIFTIGLGVLVGGGFASIPIYFGFVV